MSSFELPASIDRTQFISLKVLHKLIRNRNLQDENPDGPDAFSHRSRVPKIVSELGILFPLVGTEKNKYPRKRFAIDWDFNPEGNEGPPDRLEFSLSPFVESPNDPTMIGSPLSPLTIQTANEQMGFDALIGHIDTHPNAQEEYYVGIYGQELKTGELTAIALDQQTTTVLVHMLFEAAMSKVG